MENKKEKRQITVAIALIKNDYGKILLQKRVDPLILDADKKWEFPGGKVEYGEDPKDTVKRESLEEIGCQIELTGILPLIQSSVWKRTDDKEQHVLVICYEAKLINGTPSSSDKKVSEIQWFSENEIKQLDTLRGIWDFINLSNKK